MLPEYRRQDGVIKVCLKVDLLALLTELGSSERVVRIGDVEEH
jgi:hypothetical protein